MCKHEWCWICKQAFPVHTSECPKYDQYLELLHFQGMENSMLEGDESIHPNGWFMYSGGFGSIWFWFTSFIFLLLVGMPCIVVFNVFVTPVYMLSLMFKCLGLDSSAFKARFWLVSFLVIAFILLYSTVPIVFFIVTMPQLIFHLAKKVMEMKDLCKNRCRRYRKLSVVPINKRLMRSIGLQ